MPHGTIVEKVSAYYARELKDTKILGMVLLSPAAVCVHDGYNEWDVVFDASRYDVLNRGCWRDDGLFPPKIREYGLGRLPGEAICFPFEKVEHLLPENFSVFPKRKLRLEAVHAINAKLRQPEVEAIINEALSGMLGPEPQMPLADDILGPSPQIESVTTVKGFELALLFARANLSPRGEDYGWFNKPVPVYIIKHPKQIRISDAENEKGYVEVTGVPGTITPHKQTLTSLVLRLAGKEPMFWHAIIRGEGSELLHAHRAQLAFQHESIHYRALLQASKEKIPVTFQGTLKERDLRVYQYKVGNVQTPGFSSSEEFFYSTS